MKAGVYRHYKGPTYLVLGTAHDANANELGVSVGEYVDQEREVVVYVGLERAGKPGTPMAVRTVSDFNELLCTNGACPEYGKHTGLFGASFVVACKGCDYGLRRRFEPVE